MNDFWVIKIIVRDVAQQANERTGSDIHNDTYNAIYDCENLVRISVKVEKSRK